MMPTIAAAFTRGEDPYNGDPLPLKLFDFEAGDLNFLYRSGMVEGDPIDSEQGIYNVIMKWRIVAAVLARTCGWTEHGTDGAPHWSRGENGASLRLPSGAWVSIADVDITDSPTLWTDIEEE